MPARKRRLAAVALALIAVLALFGWLSRPPRPRYTVTDLGVLPGVFMSGPATSNASGINAQGDVVSLSGPGAPRGHAFLYRGGVMTDLGPSGLFSSHGGPAISDSGQVTGVLRVTVPLSVSGSGQQFHAFLYGASGMRDLGHPLGTSMSMGDAINSHGQIAGEAWGNKPVSGGYMGHAFLYSGGRFTDIGTLPGCTDTTPTGINAAGQVVGYSETQNARERAFLYDAGTRKVTALVAPPGFPDVTAAGINDRGQIIGTVDLPTQKERAVLWDNGRATDIGTLPGMDNAAGAALNNRGEVVGLAYAGQGTMARFVSDHPIRLGFLIPLFGQGRRGSQVAFLYRAGRMEDLNTLIPAHSGWVLQEAQGINDRGQIGGSGLHNGQKRAFLLTPR